MSPVERLANAFHKKAAKPKTKARKRPSPLSIRISDEEQALLKEAAGGRSVTALC